MSQTIQLIDDAHLIAAPQIHRAYMLGIVVQVDRFLLTQIAHVEICDDFEFALTKPQFRQAADWHTPQYHYRLQWMILGQFQHQSVYQFLELTH